LDVNVTPVKTEPLGSWILQDLLGRQLGHIKEALAAEFMIYPGSGSQLFGIKNGPYTSLDAALSAIETHTRGQCQLSCSNKDPHPEP
jgi:hypothetical protein